MYVCVTVFVCVFEYVPTALEQINKEGSKKQKEEKRKKGLDGDDGDDNKERSTEHLKKRKRTQLSFSFQLDSHAVM